MDFEDECVHWKLNKVLLSFFGLWPYQSILSKCGGYLMFIFWGLTCIVPMVQGLGDTANQDIAIAFETSIGLLTVCGAMAQCTSFLVRHKSVKNLCEHIKIDWKNATTTEERMVLKKFSEKGRRLSIINICVFTSGYFWFTFLTYFPLLFEDEIARSDYSKIFPYYSSRWVINDSYRNVQVFIHSSLGCFYAGWLFIAVMNFYICNVEHICALYVLVGLRLRNILNDEEVMVVSVMKETVKLNNDKIKAKFLWAIRKHKQAIKSVRIMSRMFKWIFFVLETCLLIILAMLTFDVIYSMKESMWLSTRIFSITVLYYSYVFYMNYGGQQIIQYSSNIVICTYYMRWYLMNVDSRKILLMILERSIKGDELSAGVMILSSSNFARVMEVTWMVTSLLLTLQRKRYS